MQVRALRRRPQPRPFVRPGDGGGGALALGSPLRACPAGLPLALRSLARSRSAAGPAGVSASPPLGSAPPSAHPAGGGGSGSSRQERQARPAPRPSSRRLRGPARPRPWGGPPRSLPPATHTHRGLWTCARPGRGGGLGWGPGGRPPRGRSAGAPLGGRPLARRDERPGRPQGRREAGAHSAGREGCPARGKPTPGAGTKEGARWLERNRAGPVRRLEKNPDTLNGRERAKDLDRSQGQTRSE